MYVKVITRTNQAKRINKMNSYNVITVDQIHPLKVSANSIPEALEFLTRDAFLGGYQIPSHKILEITEITK